MQERAQGCRFIQIDHLQQQSGTSVIWLGGAGFLILHREACLLIDPLLTTDENGRTEAGHVPFFPMPIRPSQLPKHTAVLYTHADGDHMGLRTAFALPEDIEFFAPARCIRDLKNSGIAEHRLHLIHPGETFRLSAFSVSAIAADHSWQVLDPDAYGPPFGPEDCVGFDIRTPGSRLLFPGDTRLCPHHLTLPDAYDLMALDVSEDPFHLGHEDTVRLARHLSRAALLPCHFGTYEAPDALPHNGSLTKLKAQLGADAARVLPDVIGQPVRL